MSRAYDIAFRLNGQLNGSYRNAFSQAETIAQKTTGAIKRTIAGLAGIVISTAGIKDFVDTYKEYQQEITNTAAVAGVEVGSEEYEMLDKAARAAGKATTKTAQESAAALGYMSLAGWDAQESISGLMPILRLSEATQADLATTSDLVTDSMSALGLEVKDLGRYLDIAAQANNKSNQTATQMLEAYIGVGGTFKNFKTDLTESGALLGVLANRGIKGSEAGNKLQSTLVNLTKKSGESYKAMQALGVSAYDSEGRFIGVTATLQKLNAAAKDMTEEQRNTYFTMIGGKNQLTTLNALMSGLNTMTESGVSELEALQKQLDNSNGALDRMANTMNSTFGSSVKLLNSAWDDFKIGVVSQIEPYITPIIRSLADKLPDMTEKTVLFINRSASAVGGLWSKGKAFFTWIGNNKNAIGSGLAGIGSAIMTYKLGSTAITAAKGIGALVTVAAAHPVAAGFLAAAAGIGAVAFNIARLKKEAVNSSLAEHFGNISLSLSEIKDLSDTMFKDASFYNMAESMSSLELADKYFGDFKAAAKEIEKLNFRVQLGLELGEGDIENYRQQIESYISSALSTIDEKQYAIHLSLSEFVGDESDITKGIDDFYTKNRAQVAELGTKLQAEVNKAFEDGLLDVDEANVIADYQKQMEELLNGAMNIEYESKMEAIRIKFSGADLTADTYKQLMAEGTRAMAEYTQNTDKAFEASIAVLKTRLAQDVNYTAKQYEADLEAITAGYREKISGLSSKLYELQTNTIMDTYGEDILPYMEQVNKIINDQFELMELNLKQEGADVSEIMSQTINDIKTEISAMDIPDELKGALKDIYSPDVLNQIISEAEAFGGNVPESLRQGLLSTSAIGALSGDIDALWTLVGQRFSKEDGEIQSALKNAAESGEMIPQKVIDGMNAGLPNAVRQAGSNASKIMRAFEAGLAKNITVHVNVATSMSGGIDLQNYNAAAISKIKGFAGGTEHTPDTFIAGENGAELITNAAGYKVYDALETGRLFERSRELWAEFDKNASRAAEIWAKRSAGIETMRENKAQYGGETSITVNMPNITINGNADSATVESIKEAMAESKDEVVRAVLRVLAERESRKARLSNG